MSRLRKWPADQPTVESIIPLTQALVRTPSRAGIDSYQPIFKLLSEWLEARGVAARIHHGLAGGPVALEADVVGSEGPRFVLNATVDTASFGDEGAWSVSPLS